ncbi:transcription elongation factor Elf1 like-domain-containing protein [Schizothecium vesticola]|uniref:Transcription elongation factor 1 homolog n=1 Tax=Schizothecium vesticola TaxID=314040 RepID=A0AA40FBN1_9PEZI|nr:transcription elongation factor Elf1 like-domain-containing protein [Schizothecium vesticola]
MGKRKSSKKPPPKRKNEALSSTFACLFCNHEDAVTVKLEKKLGVGMLECKVCSQKFQCGIHYLSAAIDVYSEWIDAADAVAQDGNSGAGPEPYRGTARRSSTGPAGPSKKKTNVYDDDDDDRGYEGDGIVGDEDEYE